MSRKGTINKNKQFLLSRLQDMYGDDFHPIMRIAENCHVVQKAADDIVVPALPEKPDADDIKERQENVDRMITALKGANYEWSRLAEYTEPKLKAIEINLEATLGLSDLTGSELDRKLKALEVALEQSTKA